MKYLECNNEFLYDWIRHSFCMSDRNRIRHVNLNPRSAALLFLQPELTGKFIFRETDTYFLAPSCFLGLVDLICLYEEEKNLFLTIPHIFFFSPSNSRIKVLLGWGGGLFFAS